jgi:hypothetical protein
MCRKRDRRPGRRLADARAWRAMCLPAERRATGRARVDEQVQDRQRGGAIGSSYLSECILPGLGATAGVHRNFDAAAWLPPPNPPRRSRRCCEHETGKSTRAAKRTVGQDEERFPPIQQARQQGCGGGLRGRSSCNRACPTVPYDDNRKGCPKHTCKRAWRCGYACRIARNRSARSGRAAIGGRSGRCGCRRSGPELRARHGYAHW